MKSVLLRLLEITILIGLTKATAYLWNERAIYVGVLLFSYIITRHVVVSKAALAARLTNAARAKL